MIAHIEGRIGFIKTLKKGGISIAIAEKKNNKLQKAKWHYVVAWGKKAKAIRNRIKIGLVLRCHCNISLAQKKGKTYMNCEIQTWTIVEGPKYDFSARIQEERSSDDWFVPTTQPAAQTNYQRRYEGFESRR